MTPGVTSFVLLTPDLKALLRRCFTDSWIASYQIGFGPPAIKSSPALIARAKTCTSALDKLDAYLDHCILDATERDRLAKFHRALLVRRHGPVEAETIDAASADVFDLSLRLHTPLRAPSGVRSSMAGNDVGPDTLDPELPPVDVSARFYLLLTDAKGERLLDIDEVKAASPGPETFAIELRAPIEARRLYAAWLKRLKDDAGILSVELGQPASHARVLRDGARN